MIDLLLDQLLDAFRYSDLDIRDVNNQLPMSLGFSDQSFRQNVIYRVNHNQRTSLPSFVYQRGKLGRETIAAESNRQILRNCLFAEIFQRQLLALLLGQQLPLNRLERMPAHNQLYRAIG